MTDTTQQEREFERWWRDEGQFTRIPEGETSDGEFERACAYAAWKWQAARATPQGAEPVAEGKTKCSMSWGGFYLRGDEKSIKRALTMLHDSEEVVPSLRAALLEAHAHPPEPKLSELQADAKQAIYELIGANERWGLTTRRAKAVEAAYAVVKRIDAELARQEGSAT